MTTSLARDRACRLLAALQPPGTACAVLGPDGALLAGDDALAVRAAAALAAAPAAPSRP